MTLPFRQKAILALLLFTLVATALLFPFSQYSVRHITRNSLLDRADLLIALIRPARTEEGLGHRLQEQRHLVFSRVAIIKPDRTVLYDTKARDILQGDFDPDVIVRHPEVEEAFQRGTGYREAWSSLLQQDLIYVARAFNFDGRTYVLRTAFPYSLMDELTTRFELGMVTVALLFALFLLIIIFAIIHYLTQPIQTIIAKIRPYQEGKEEMIPHLELPGVHPDDDFARLAATLNQLSDRIATQIGTLKNERNEKLTLLDTLNEGIVSVDQTITITYANGVAKQLLHVKEGQPFTEHPACSDLLQLTLDQQSTLSDTLVIGGPQRTFLQLVAIPMGETNAILVLQDISAHFQALQMTRDFVANASHELRTPITVIRGFAEALHDNPDLPREKSQEITQRIISHSERMTNLVSTLLKLAEVENIQEREEEQCNIEAAADHAMSLVRERFPNADISISVAEEDGVVASARPELVEQIFENLLSNAARYSGQEAKIEVRIREQASRVIVDVADNGAGIPAEDLPHIFTRFYTVDKARSRAAGGTGLGLAIVSTIITKLNGTIDVQSVVGKGTTFTFTLPAYHA